MMSAGCDDNDESEVRITNLDNHDYTVRLYRDSDDSLVGELNVDRGETRDFDNVADGKYYISIFRDGEASPRDTSSSFTIENDEDRSFYISDSGNIH